ncbi:MAG: DUF2829 domain-containing protein [Pseudomonadota bacterium]|nr:DUF2829 domain-containing protein [Pseudomonadota bacterium]
MKKYIGTKLIQAEPALSTKESGIHPIGSQGYKVIYPDGYASWSPKEEFEKAYRETSGMSFGLAIEAMKKGFKVCRAGWNGKGMFLFLVPGSQFKVSRAPLLGIYPEGTEINYCPHIDMKTADEKVVPWLASQTDMLADDWQIVE